MSIKLLDLNQSSELTDLSITELTNIIGGDFIGFPVNNLYGSALGLYSAGKASISSSNDVVTFDIPGELMYGSTFNGRQPFFTDNISFKVNGNNVALVGVNDTTASSRGYYDGGQSPRENSI